MQTCFMGQDQEPGSVEASFFTIRTFFGFGETFMNEWVVQWYFAFIYMDYYYFITY